MWYDTCVYLWFVCILYVCVVCFGGGRWAHKRLYRRGGLKPGGMSLKEEVGKSCEDVLGASKLASAGRHGRSWVSKMKGFSRLAGIGPSCGKQGLMGHLRPWVGVAVGPGEERDWRAREGTENWMRWPSHSQRCAVLAQCYRDV